MNTGHGPHGPYEKKLRYLFSIKKKYLSIMDTNVVSSSNGLLNEHRFFGVNKPLTNDEKVVKTCTGNVRTNLDNPFECFWSTIMIVPLLNVT